MNVRKRSPVDDVAVHHEIKVGGICIVFGDVGISEESISVGVDGKRLRGSEVTDQGPETRWEFRGEEGAVTRKRGEYDDEKEREWYE